MRKGMTHSEAGKLGALASLGYKKRQHQDAVFQYQKNPKLCKQCGTPLHYESRRNQFCSKSCAAILNNTRRRIQKIKETNHNQGCIQVVVNNNICKCCGIPIPSYRKFCSLECHRKYKWNKKVREIEDSGFFMGGRGRTNQGEASRSFVRKYLSQKFGYKCFICGTSEWCGKPLTLIVDHFDGNPLNNKVENFRLVCPNCDSQLSTYKARNKGHGREFRRKRFSGDFKNGV